MLLSTKYVLIIISPFCPPCLLCLVDLPEVTGTHRKFRSIVSSLIGMDFIPDAGIALYQVQATARTFTSEKIRFDYNKNTYYLLLRNTPKTTFCFSKKKKKKHYLLLLFLKTSVHDNITNAKHYKTLRFSSITILLTITVMAQKSATVIVCYYCCFTVFDHDCTIYDNVCF